MATNAVLQFAHDPDPQARRTELLAFIGPRPDGFIHLYDYLAKRDPARANRLGDGLAYNGFSAPAFFLGPVWFFYRKMWLIGAVYVIAMLGLAAFPVTGRADVGLAVAMALFARWAYVHHAVRKIASLRATETADRQAFLNTLAEAGGVSRAGGWISGILFLAAIGLAVMQALT